MLAYNHQSGFNSGYILAEYEPTVISEVTKGLNKNSPYAKGVVYGGNQYLLIQLKLRSLEALRLNRCDRN